jgi:hypothetical protein
MSFIDFILNLAGLLLWFNWRSMRFDPLASRRPATLIGTLRPAGAAGRRRWIIFLSLPTLLVLRAALYWLIGAPAEWVPKLDLGAVVLAFRVDRMDYALIFSLVSFLRVMGIAYVWLVALALLNRGVEDPDPVLRLIRLQAGRISRAPLALQVLAPILAILVCWATLHPLMACSGVLGPARSAGQVLGQGLLAAAGVVFSLKLLLPLILLLHMLSTYVYLGASPLWEFVSETARGILAPMPVKSLRSSKLDFAPLAGIVLIILLLHTVPTLAMRFASSQGVTVWPE